MLRMRYFTWLFKWTGLLRGAIRDRRLDALPRRHIGLAGMGLASVEYGRVHINARGTFAP
jgi:hypothetical protein